MKSSDPELMKEVAELLKEKPLAVKFLLSYKEYIHAIDDLVDEPEKNLDTIQRIGVLSVALFSSEYWMQNREQLCMVEMLTNLTYFDSVDWEFAKEDWKKWDAKCLSHCGYNMCFAVMILELGFEVTKQYSLRIREQAHKDHLSDMAIPVIIKAA